MTIDPPTAMNENNHQSIVINNLDAFSGIISSNMNNPIIPIIVIVNTILNILFIKTFTFC